MATKEIKAVDGEAGPGSQILATAKKGESAAASLLKFTTDFTQNWTDIEVPLSRLTVLCSRTPLLLTDLGIAVNEYKEIVLPDTVIRFLSERIGGCFERIEEELKGAEGDETEGKIKGG